MMALWEAEDEREESSQTPVRNVFAAWHLSQAVCTAARAPPGASAAAACQAPPALVAALGAAGAAGISAVALSAVRNAEGLSALGCQRWRVRARGRWRRC